MSDGQLCLLRMTLKRSPAKLVAGWIRGYIYISSITIENTIADHNNIGSHGVQVILQFEFVDLPPV